MQEERQQKQEHKKQKAAGMRRGLTEKGKKKLIHAVEGSISILLCLVLTPFITVALGLVEYARYQQVIELTEEIFELTGVSALSSYDPYIHQRFGFLAAAQDSLGGDYDTILTDNAALLGKQFSIANPAITGSLPISDQEILKKQLLDFSELTVPAAVLAEDLQLNELLAKLSNFTAFSKISNVVDGLSNVTDKVKTAVDNLKALKEAIFGYENFIGIKSGGLINAIEDAKNKAKSLTEKAGLFFQKLVEGGKYMQPESATLPMEPASSSNGAEPSPIEQMMADFINDSSGLTTDLVNLFKEADAFKTSLTTVQSCAEDVIAKFSAFKTSVNDAKTALNSLVSSNESKSDKPVDNNASITKKATSAIDDALKELEKSITGSLKSLEDGVVDEIKEKATNIITKVLNSFNLSGEVSKYSDIVSGNYFTLPLSESAKNDLLNLFKTVQKAHDENPGSTGPALLDGLKNFLLSKDLVPKFTITSDNLSSLENQINEIVGDALNKIKTDTEKSALDIITQIIDTVRTLFELDVFYEPVLNSAVTLSDTADSPYQAFLEAIGTFFEAIEKVKGAFTDSGFNLFKKLGDLLTGVGDFFKSVGQMFTSIFGIINSKISGIISLGSDLAQGDLFERLLISGYMRHNMPCRTDVPNEALEADDLNANVILENEGLTGMKYQSIARPPSFSFKSEVDDKDFTELHDLVQQLQNGAGSAPMFKGAELEYINIGTYSEIANQVFTFMDIYFLRLLLDFPSVFMDGEVAGLAGAASIACWAVYLIYILVEPFLDTLLLVNGGKVPLIRTDCYLTPSRIGSYLGNLGNEVLSPELKTELESAAKKNTYTDSAGSTPELSSSNDAYSLGDGGVMDIDYKTTLFIVMFLFTKPDDQINRLKNLMTLECSLNYKDSIPGYSLDKAYTTVRISGDVTFQPFFDLGIASGGSSSIFTSHISRSYAY